LDSRLSGGCSQDRATRMKLLVFAHVPPPHHGQAVMVELMLRGLSGESLDRINRINRIEGNGGRGSARAEEWPQKDAKDTKNVEGRGASVEGCSRTRERLEGGRTSGKVGSYGDSPSSETDEGHSHILKNVRMSDEGEGEDLRFKFKIQESRREGGRTSGKVGSCGDSPSGEKSAHAEIRPPGEPDEVTVFHVNAQVSDDLEDVGGFRIEKLLRLLGFCWEAVKIRWKHGPMDWYYVPAPAKKSAILRDWIVMLLVRPWFRRTIFHWHAFGLGHWATGTTEEPRGGSFQTGLTRLTGLEGDGGRGSVRADSLPQKDAEDTKNLEEEEPQIDDRGRDVRPACPPREGASANVDDLSAGESHGHRGTGVPTRGNSTDERAAHPLLPRTRNQERSFARYAQPATRNGSEAAPPVLFGRFEGVARWLTRWLMGGADVSIVLTEYNRRDAELLNPRKINT
jgi:hypothetical protein